MSAEATGWVWANSPFDGATRLVHLALADVANDLHDNTVWASQATIAKKTHCVRQTVNASLAELLEQGYLELLTECVGRPNKYRFLFPKVSSQATGGVVSDDRYLSNLTTGGVVPGDTNPRELNVLTQEELKSLDSEIEIQTDAMRLCSLLADLIEANGSKRPTVTKAWEVTMDRLMRIDQRSSEQVEAAIRWSQQHDFWSGNVLSPTKLRKHYDAMRIQARRESGSKTGSKGLATLAALDNQLSRKELS